ncbi:MAG: hypothetical protein ACLQC0_02235 [Thermoplasmata archaeon]
MARPRDVGGKLRARRPAVAPVELRLTPSLRDMVKYPEKGARELHPTTTFGPFRVVVSARSWKESP